MDFGTTFTPTSLQNGSWRRAGGPWAALGTLLGALGALLGSLLGSALEPSWATLGAFLRAPKSRFAEKPKIIDSTAFFIVFGTGPGPSLEGSGPLWAIAKAVRSSVALGWHRLVMSCEAATELSGNQRTPTATQLRPTLKCDRHWYRW